MHALHTIEQQRPTRRRRARRALVVAAVPHFAITRTDASGKKTAYTYNALGQVARRGQVSSNIALAQTIKWQQEM